jgi:hypothetical protein
MRVFLALFIQPAKGMRHAILSSVASLALPRFSKLPHKRNGFRKKLFIIKCVLIFSTNLSEIFLNFKNNF